MNLRTSTTTRMASLTLYAGVKSPGKGKESHWLPAPQDKFSLFIRACWPEKSILDNTWLPPKVERAGQPPHVRFWHLADIGWCTARVCF